MINQDEIFVMKRGNVKIPYILRNHKIQFKKCTQVILRKRNANEHSLVSSVNQCSGVLTL